MSSSNDLNHCEQSTSHMLILAFLRDEQIKIPQMLANVTGTNYLFHNVQRKGVMKSFEGAFVIFIKTRVIDQSFTLEVTMEPIGHFGYQHNCLLW